MHTYVVKRVLLMIPTLFGVSLVVWAVTAAAPEPPIQSQLPSMEAGKQAGEAGGLTQAVKAYRAQYGLDRPAILNFYYDLDAEEVGAALRDTMLEESDAPDAIERKLRASERLIRWGYYAVPAMVTLLQDADGRLRDVVSAWFGKSAERVTQFDSSVQLDEKTAAENAFITEENRLLKLFEFEAEDTPENKTAKAAAVRTWFEGARGGFEDEVPVETVRAALQRGEAGFGRGAVPALVGIVLSDDDLRDDAVRALVRAGRSEDELTNRVLARLAWPEGASSARRRAGIEMVRTWWHGSKDRWDYGGIRWFGVMLFETQFARFWENLLRFDFGYSSVHKQRVSELILQRLKYSLTLNLSALVLAFLISVPIGLLSARIHGSVPEKGITIVLFILYSLPSFFVATLMIAFLAEGQKGSLEIIPTGDFESPNAWEMTTIDRVKDILWHIAAPIFCLTYASLAALSRYAKTGLLNVIRSDYVRTAKAKGLSDFVVTYKHAARPGIIPVITLLGGTLPVVVSGSFIIEWIFGIPGFGLLLIESVKSNDFNVIVGISVIVAILTMIGILLSDLLYAVADPRISFS